MTQPNDPLLTIQQVAARLSVTTRTVQRYLANGTLRGVRIGPRLVRVPESALQAIQVQIPMKRGPKPR